MAFCHRVFSRQPSLPTLSELLLGVRRRGLTLELGDGTPAHELALPFWRSVALRADPADEPFLLERLQREVGTGSDLAAELADFREDVDELPPGDGRDAVSALLSETVALIRVVFPADGLGPRSEAAIEVLCDVLVAQGDGLVQRDGSGFFDEDGDEVLALG